MGQTNVFTGALKLSRDNVDQLSKAFRITTSAKSLDNTSQGTGEAKDKEVKEETEAHSEVEREPVAGTSLFKDVDSNPTAATKCTMPCYLVEWFRNITQSHFWGNKSWGGFTTDLELTKWGRLHMRPLQYDLAQPWNQTTSDLENYPWGILHEKPWGLG